MEVHLGYPHHLNLTRGRSEALKAIVEAYFES
ncbi:hypothetical protein [Salmonella phage NINP13076]|uniref:Uncharacterized protein n=1 Tax=Salmonella phage vB_SEnST11_KE22 TaxID=3161173 RepID=A0AAU8GF38_9CAUD|nr:hypothetical protein [Salmonella phage NINP13076]